MSDAVDFSAVLAPASGPWDQGDIVEAVYFAAFDKVLPGVLVTPSCDIEQDKVDLWTFVALFPDVEVAKAAVAKDLADWKLAPGAAPSNKQRNALSKTLAALVCQRLPRYHWIPVRMGASTAHVADFSCVTAIPAAEVQKTSKRVATLRSSWREQLPARYSAFMARVGTLDFKEDVLAKDLERLVNAVFAG